MLNLNSMLDKSTRYDWISDCFRLCPVKQSITIFICLESNNLSHMFKHYSLHKCSVAAVIYKVCCTLQARFRLPNTVHVSGSPTVCGNSIDNRRSAKQASPQKWGSHGQEWPLLVSTPALLRAIACQRMTADLVYELISPLQCLSASSHRSC